MRAANTHATSKATGIKIYPRDLKVPVGGKRVKALSIERRCDWPERELPTPRSFKGDGYKRKTQEIEKGRSRPKKTCPRV